MQSGCKLRAHGPLKCDHKIIVTAGAIIIYLVVTTSEPRATLICIAALRQWQHLSSTLADDSYWLRLGYSLWSLLANGIMDSSNYMLLR